jgi:hypothetical protein
MELNIDSLFNNIPNLKQQIISKMREGDFNYILNNLCYIKDDYIVIDSIFFKHFATPDTYAIITQFVMNRFDEYLSKHPLAVVHLNISSINVSLLDKHKSFLMNVSQIFSLRYPDILKVCYVYNATFICSQLFNIISLFVDKITMQKIHIVKK